MIFGQFIPGNSFLHRMDPRTKIGFVFVLMLLIFFSNNLICYSLLFLFLLFVLRLTRISLILVVRSLRMIWFLVLITSFLHFWFTNEGTIVFQFSGFVIYEEGIKKAILVAVRLILLVLTASLLTFTTSSIDLIDALENIFQPFARFGFPAHEFALMMSITLSMIPLLWDELQKVRKAQISRGARFDEGWIWQRFQYHIHLFIPLFLSIFRRSDALAIAMESRCYRGNINRTKLRQLRYTHIDGYAVIILLILAVGLLWLRE